MMWQVRLRDLSHRIRYYSHVMELVCQSKSSCTIETRATSIPERDIAYNTQVDLCFTMITRARHNEYSEVRDYE